MISGGSSMGGGRSRGVEATETAVTASWRTSFPPVMYITLMIATIRMWIRMAIANQGEFRTQTRRSKPGGVWSGGPPGAMGGATSGAGGGGTSLVIREGRTEVREEDRRLGHPVECQRNGTRAWAEGLRGRSPDHERSLAEGRDRTRLRPRARRRVRCSGAGA